jgi:hypothetical protein
LSAETDRTKLFQAAVDLLGSSGRKAVIRVEGVSMRPTFPGETRILVDFAARSPAWGDIVLFHQAGSMVVHRFLGRVDSRRFGPCLRTRGDGSSALDPPLMDPDLLGLVVAYRRAGTWYGLDGAGARFWARLTALHDRLWAAIAVFAGRLDRALARFGLPRRLRRLAEFLDRTGLRIGDRLLFRILHRKIDPPDLAEIDLQVEGRF